MSKALWEPIGADDERLPAGYHRGIIIHVATEFGEPRDDGYLPNIIICFQEDDTNVSPIPRSFAAALHVQHATIPEVRAEACAILSLHGWIFGGKAFYSDVEAVIKKCYVKYTEKRMAVLMGET